MKQAAFIVVLLLTATCASAHRLDDYLQCMIVSLKKDRVTAELFLTPGIAAVPTVLALIDADGNGAISVREQQAYAMRVQGDLSVSIDGHPLALRLRSMEFPRLDELKDGSGEIHVQFEADLPPGGAERKLELENHHALAIGAYLVNCLRPNDPDLSIVAQVRNESQSRYELDYHQAGVRTATQSVSRGRPLVAESTKTLPPGRTRAPSKLAEPLSP